MDSLRVNCPHLLLLLFMQVFIPYGYSDHASPSSACAIFITLTALTPSPLYRTDILFLIRFLMGQKFYSHA